MSDLRGARLARTNSRKFGGTLVLLISLVLFLGCNSKPEAAGKVLLQRLPEAIQKSIAESLRIEVEELADDDLDAVVSLNLNGPTLKDLSGLEVLPNLRDLCLDGVGVRTLESLGPLPHLQSLWVRGRSLETLDGIESLTGLEELNLVRTNVRSLEPLRSLHNLRKILIVETPVEDPRPIAQLPQLQRLALVGTEIKDIASLEDLQKRCIVYFEKREP